MAITPDTQVNYVGDGVTTLFAFAFPYEQAADVYCTVDGVITPFTFSTPSLINVTPAPAVDAEIAIYRSTPASNTRYVFSTGVPFLTKFADANWKQLLYTLQEVVQGIKNNTFSLLKTLRAPDLLSTLPKAVDRRNKVLGFDTVGQPIVTDAGYWANVQNPHFADNVFIDGPNALIRINDTSAPFTNVSSSIEFSAGYGAGGSTRGYFGYLGNAYFDWKCPLDDIYVQAVSGSLEFKNNGVQVRGGYSGTATESRITLLNAARDDGTHLVYDHTAASTTLDNNNVPILRGSSTLVNLYDHTGSVAVQIDATATKIKRDSVAVYSASSSGVTLQDVNARNLLSYTGGQVMMGRGTATNNNLLYSDFSVTSLYNFGGANQLLAGSAGATQLYDPAGNVSLASTTTTVSLSIAGATRVVADATNMILKSPNGNSVLAGTNTTTQLLKNGYATLDLSTTGTRLYDQTNAPLLYGVNTGTTLYRNGQEVFRADGTDVRVGSSASALALKSAPAAVLELRGLDSYGLNLQASSDVLNLYRNTTTAANPVILANASTFQLFGVSAPILTATTTTAQINSGNGAPAISIDSTGKCTTVNNFLIPTTYALGINSQYISAVSSGEFSYKSSASGLCRINLSDSAGVFQGGVYSDGTYIGLINRVGNVPLTISATGSAAFTNTPTFVGVPHDVQSVNGTGKGRLMKNVSAGNITAGSTAAGSALSDVYFTSGGVLTAGSAPTGTWKNIANRTIVNGETGEWLRIS